MGLLEKLMAECIRSVDELREVLGLSEEESQELQRITERYPICITPYYLGLIDREDENDPIRKMCLLDRVEFSEGGEEDTSGESDNTVMQGLQHKYKQTALILSTNQCVMYCRHCFRKRMVGYSGNEIADHLPAMEEYVREHKEINNVLISGGDAFVNANETIEKYLEHFISIPTLDFIRFGTRIPVVLPQRITEDEALLGLLKEYGNKKQLIIATQFNHPRELTPEAVKAVRALRDCGCIVRNQTVLLKGVNDEKAILADLMNGLMSCGVVPYYIFQCRPAAGVKNKFQVPFLRGWEAVEQAKALMNGHSKSVRYVLSHPTGKIEVIGLDGSGKMIFKYHQAKEAKNQSRIFSMELDSGQCWLQST